MKIDSFELFLDNDKQFYMAGDEVIGHIELVVNQRVRIARLTIQLTGIVQTCWRERVCVFYFWARGLINFEDASDTPKMTRQNDPKIGNK